MKKYTKKQIVEAIAYWKNQLKKMNENINWPSHLPKKPDIYQYEVKLLAHENTDTNEYGEFELKYKVEARDSEEAYELACSLAKKDGYDSFDFNETEFNVDDDTLYDQYEDPYAYLSWGDFKKEVEAGGIKDDDDVNIQLLTGGIPVKDGYGECACYVDVVKNNGAKIIAVNVAGC